MKKRIDKGKRTKRVNKRTKRVNKRRVKTNRVNKRVNKRVRKSIKNAQMIPRKRYKKLLTKKRNKKSLNKNEKKELDRALFVNYCKCIKKLKHCDKNIEKGHEYPICMKSIYLNRGIKKKDRQGVQKRCEGYH